MGRTGVEVSPLCLGAMMFGAWGNPDHDESIRIIHAALDAGINFVDTADVYSRGESEEIVGKALTGRRDNVVLATKFHGTMGDDPNERGSSRRWIVREVEDSLRRLAPTTSTSTRCIAPDPDTDIDETLGALTDLSAPARSAPSARSTFPPPAIVEAQWTAERRGRERFVCEQPPYSMLVRGIEADVLPTCQRYGMGVLPWSPLPAAGCPASTAGRRRRRELARRPDPRALRPLDAGEPAQARRRRRARPSWPTRPGISLIHLAIAFVIRHPAVTAAIIGPRTMEQLESQLGAADVVLSDDVLDASTRSCRRAALNPADGGYAPPALADAALRRRA